MGVGKVRRTRKIPYLQNPSPFATFKAKHCRSSIETFLIRAVAWAIGSVIDPSSWRLNRWGGLSARGGGRGPLGLNPCGFLGCLCWLGNWGDLYGGLCDVDGCVAVLL